MEERYIEIQMPDWFDLLVPDGDGRLRFSDGMFPASDFMRAPGRQLRNVFRAPGTCRR